MNILITGGRFFYALDLARAFSVAGHKVFIAECHRPHLCVASNAVTKCVQIPSPRYEYRAFVNKLREIIEQHEIDLVVPVFEETLYLARAKEELPKNCEYFCDSAQTLNQLHNKWLFHKLLEKNLIKAIPTQIITNKEDFSKVDFDGPYILKPSYSRGSMSMQRSRTLEGYKNITYSADNPWVLQKLIVGKRNCSYSICKNGKILAHSLYANNVEKKDWCIYFESIEDKKVYDWVTDIVAKMNFTGQISFDFIEDLEGNLYCIECNPRATYGIHLLSEEQVGESFFAPSKNTIFADLGVKKQLASGMLVYGWGYREEGEGFFHFFSKFFKYRDVIFSKRDLKPFIFQPMILSTYFFRYLCNKHSLPQSFIDDILWD